MSENLENNTLPIKDAVGEVVLYQPNDQVSIEVRLDKETIWLTQQQIADLFGVKRPAITKHLGNIFREGELDANSVCSILELTAADGKVYSTQFYNLDAILSVGYRVNSKNATIFRRWANTILKDYLLRGYSVNQRLMYVEERIDHRLHTIENTLAQHQEKIDFFVRTSLPPSEGVIFDGKVFDAYELFSKIIKTATKRIVLFDNYIDESVLYMLDKRNAGVKATIYTKTIDARLQADIARHDAQYEHIDVQVFNKAHDRFLCIDDTVYHIGASLKDLGKKWFAFSQMVMTTDDLLGKM